MKQIDRKEVIKRLSGRRICPKCNEEYHIIYNPPTNEGICNRCNVDLFEREDEGLDAVSAQHERYVESSPSLIQHYKRRKILTNIDGSGSADRVSEEIAQALEASR